ncbi:hypothetical protein EIN_044530 [Entamoeba invadens IP1]|uniref:Uncharacterized protein n=1 Tax=Entamoeba invadens IP1 TaxID=370355 RepID=A0A0A1TZ83_ENTIV|nr:hypothetical protein EIN_044530 [Entamoeba invadens IP1]ELP86895.1 hypothetical protein EIN_044530 [Entamoeba invadens IP1]|eukprot:XP_004253666.1 hypothetical protein EIN_044530 [Entamoeba invadens IP1]
MCETLLLKKQNPLREFTLPAEIKYIDDENSQRKTPLYKRLPVLRKSRENRNNFTLQQTFCICLLSPFCKITLKKPSRRSSVTEQFFRIGNIYFADNSETEVNAFLKKRCDEMYATDVISGVPEKTAMRRYQNNKKIEMIHFLSDLVFFNGYNLTYSGKQGKITNTLENIDRAEWNGFSLKFDVIIPKLIEANHLLLEKVNHSEGDYIVDSKIFNGNFLYSA